MSQYHVSYTNNGERVKRVINTVKPVKAVKRHLAAQGFTNVEVSK